MQIHDGSASSSQQLLSYEPLLFPIIPQKTQKEKIEIKENIELQSQKVYDDYVSRARERAKRNDAIALAKANEKLEASKVKHQEAMAEMKKHYEKNKDIWVDELVNRVIQ